MIGSGTPVNYFSARDYYKWDMGKGVIRERGGARVMAFSQEFSVGLLAGLIDECGDAWPIVLRSCGAYWGKRQFERIEQELGTFYGARLKGVPTAVVHGAIAECFAVHGWGRVEFDLSEFSRKAMLVRVKESPAVAAVLHAKLSTGVHTVDALLAGALAAMFSQATGDVVDAKEISCVARGDARCEIVIGTPKRLEALPTLIRQRASRDEILNAIAAE